MKSNKKRELICCRCGYSNRDERRPCAFMGKSWKRHDYANNLENHPPKRERNGDKGSHQ